MICACIAEKKQLAELEHYELCELRYDMIRMDDADIEKYSASRTVIATCRENGFTRDERLAVLKRAVAAGAGYVDIEIEADDAFKKELVALSRTHGAKVIVSYHNFESTPSHTELSSIISHCIADGADIVKIVTTALNERDAATVLGLYADEYSVPLVAFAMGEAGRITRVASLRLGAPFAYSAASTDSRTANSQFSYDEMKVLFGKL